MQRFRMVFALVLAILWLPATQHCGLEAAGVLASHCEQADDSGCAGGDACADDSCKLIESGDYAPASGGVKIASPNLASYLCWICLSRAIAPAKDLESVERIRDEWTLDWVPSWQFERRAALPPGAPSLA